MFAKYLVKLGIPTNCKSRTVISVANRHMLKLTVSPSVRCVPNTHNPMTSHPSRTPNCNCNCKCSVSKCLYSRLCNWLSLRCLVPWINHLPPVCWSTFGILVWNDSGYVNLTQWWYFFIIFEYILHISTPHIMIFCFPLPYFPLSTSALFFA